MSALICGSFAFDTIMVFNDRFKHHIMPDKVHILNVSFLVPEMRREFGGCAGNIAYNLKLLGDDPLPMGTVGEDFGPYAERLDGLGISRRYVHNVAGSYTAQAYITTDLDDNQITAFHPGAMNEAHVQRIPSDAGVTIGMVSPDGRQGMLDHAQQFAAAGIPFIFDPGQGLPLFDGAELRHFIEQARWVTVNDYEFQLLRERTGWKAEDIARRVQALVITRGASGSLVYAGGREIEVPAAPVSAAVDPTGCGDAYRAGLLWGLARGLDWETTARVAALMGALKVEVAGTQNHQFTMDEFRDRYRAAFGRTLDA